MITKNTCTCTARQLYHVGCDCGFEQQIATVASDIYCAGRTEDGDEYTAEAFFVLFEDAAGRRWRHHLTFAGCVAGCDDEGFPTFADIRDEAKAKAKRLADRINRHLRTGGSLNAVCWEETFPAYGSAAYQAEGAWWAIREKAIDQGHQLGVYA